MITSNAQKLGGNNCINI